MMFGFRDEFEYFECAQCGCSQIKDILLVSDNSYGKNRSNSIFATNDIKNFRRKINELNAAQLRDSAALFIKK